MLEAIGEPARPAVPLNLVGDFGGGSMFLLASVLAALIERSSSGVGQILDVAIVDGITTLAQQIWSIRAMGVWNKQRMHNILDGGAPMYGVYQCSDGAFVAVGAIEHKFSTAPYAGLGLQESSTPGRDDPAVAATAGSDRRGVPLAPAISGSPCSPIPTRVSLRC